MDWVAIFVEMGGRLENYDRKEVKTIGLYLAKARQGSSSRKGRFRKYRFWSGRRMYD